MGEIFRVHPLKDRKQRGAHGTPGTDLLPDAATTRQAATETIRVCSSEHGARSASGARLMMVRTHRLRNKDSITCFREALDTFNFLRHVMRAILSVRPKCSHRWVSLKETPSKPVQILKHTTKNSAEQTSMRTKWFKRIAI